MGAQKLCQISSFLMFQNLPEDHDFVKCQFWDLHYVRKHELKEHYETCEHAVEKVAQRRQEKCKYNQMHLENRVQ